MLGRAQARPPRSGKQSSEEKSMIAIHAHLTLPVLDAGLERDPGGRRVAWHHSFDAIDTSWGLLRDMIGRRFACRRARCDLAHASARLLADVGLRREELPVHRDMLTMLRG